MNLPYSTKHPILLNPKHHITELTVRHSHLTVKHGGVKETLTELDRSNGSSVVEIMSEDFSDSVFPVSDLQGGLIQPRYHHHCQNFE